MTVRRIHKKTELTPEQKARQDAAKKAFKDWHPDVNELLATGEYEGPFLQGQYLALRALVLALKTVREDQGLTLAQVTERSGIDQPNLSRLENGKNANPTLDTLYRYAAAMGRVVTLGSALATPDVNLAPVPETSHK
jgi:predicted XRE-type DNA-binding protein